MCTPWTITKLLKEDCASCFLACRFPLDDEAVDDPRRYATTTPQLPIRNMAFDYQGDSGGNERVRNKNKSPSRHRKSNLSARTRQSHDSRQVRETTSTSTSTSIGSSPCRRVRYLSSDEESSCKQLPHFAEEDQNYIVFCFKDDGTFEVVKNVEQEGQNYRDSTSSKNSRQINQKNEGEKGKKICPDTKATAACSMGEVSLESSDSNQSDNSTASFAFPVLAMEWPGSPVQMPKPEELDLRKHKARCIGLRFQCCRF